MESQLVFPFSSLFKLAFSRFKFSSIQSTALIEIYKAVAEQPYLRLKHVLDKIKAINGIVYTG